ncbi:hypothetical protein MTO96_030804 [Rhipicephalus appendiculatus]
MERRFLLLVVLADGPDEVGVAVRVEYLVTVVVGVEQRPAVDEACESVLARESQYLVALFAFHFQVRTDAPVSSEHVGAREAVRYVVVDGVGVVSVDVADRHVRAHHLRRVGSAADAERDVLVLLDLSSELESDAAALDLPA